MVRRILPDQEYLRECFDYDPEDGTVRWKARPRHHFTEEASWKKTNGRMAGRIAGKIARRISRRPRLYIDIGINNSRFTAQRIIFKLMTGREPSDEVDHRDNNGLNNRWSNIRDATTQQNRRNSTGWTKRNLPKGVSTQRKKFRAVATIGRKTKYIGTFDTPELAHAAYCDAVRAEYGEFFNAGVHPIRAIE